MRHNRRDDGQLSCRKREMKTMNANAALDGHTTVIKMAERGGVPLNPCTAHSNFVHYRKVQQIQHTLTLFTNRPIVLFRPGHEVRGIPAVRSCKKH